MGACAEHAEAEACNEQHVTRSKTCLAGIHMSHAGACSGGWLRCQGYPATIRTSTCVVLMRTCTDGHTHAGSAATQSKAGPAAAPGKQRGTGRRAQAESAGPAPVFFESQQSFHEGAGAGTKRTRKASCVELPIHQVGKLQSGGCCKQHH